MNKLEKAWLAGFIDGEGCLTILKSTRRGKHKDYVDYRPMIVISNTSLRVLNYIQCICGYGSIYQREHIFPNAKLQHSLHIFRKQEILKLCRQLAPYLYLKQKHAKIIIDFCEGVVDKEMSYREIHFLNKKGEN